MRTEIVYQVAGALMTSALQFILMLLLLQTSSAETVQKKNLCTVTINSTDEADLFKKRLSSADWNFIELTPEASETGTKNWFQAACKRKISCDVLVISGHFAGSFFGKSKFTLPIEELEALSCNESCDGILNKPKEVFLFGCNTLASKEKDLRSPEEYMQVLRDDGFSAAQASQVVSFRYSGFGESFKTRMSSIFPKTPQIYGFNSKGPSGSTVHAMLDRYLLNSQSDYKNFYSAKSKPSTVRNEKLFSALQNTTLAQISGSLPNMKSVDEKPYCFIRSPNISRVEKLRYIETLLQSGNAIQMISHIEDFIHELRADSKLISNEEKEILQRLAENQKIKKELIALLKLDAEIYIPLKVHILNTLKDLDLVDVSFVETTFNHLIALDTPFSASRKDMICSSNFTANIPVDIIPAQRWTELDFIIALICLHPKNIELHRKLVEQLKTTDPIKRGTILWFFFGSQSHDLDIQLALANSLLTDTESYIRMSAAIVMRDLPLDFPQVQQIIIKALYQEKDQNVTRLILDCLSQQQLDPVIKKQIQTFKTQVK